MAIYLQDNDTLYRTKVYKEVMSKADEALGTMPNPMDSIFYEGLVSKGWS